MRKLNAFTFITLNGFYKDASNDISFHQHGEEEGDYSAESLTSGNTLLFGRSTYEMMYSFWPSTMAYQSFPLVAEGMNKAEKIVFSKTLHKADWNNTRILKENIVKEIRTLKQTEGKDMTILGSGSIVRLFSDAGLIDEYQIMLDPIVIGKGTSLFKGLKKTLHLELKHTRTFKSGALLLCYGVK